MDRYSDIPVSVPVGWTGMVPVTVMDTETDSTDTIVRRIRDDRWIQMMDNG